MWFPKYGRKKEYFSDKTLLLCESGIHWGVSEVIDTYEVGINENSDYTKYWFILLAYDRMITF